MLVPVKAFLQAKGRLAPVLTNQQRARLARRMATVVVAAAAPWPAFVVCDDSTVAGWAEEVGATVVWRPGVGLNAAVGEGVAELRRLGVRRAVIAHSDLPLAESFAALAGFDAASGTPAVSIVSDRREDGTNVIALPTDAPFTFAYGAGSFRRHSAEARRLGLAVRVVRHRQLGFDVDLPSDLAELQDLPAGATMLRGIEPLAGAAPAGGAADSCGATGQAEPAV